MAKPKLISLYSGAGGLDYGFEAAGFATGACVEFDHECCETLRRSRPSWSVLERSIFDVPTDEMLEACGARSGEVDLLIGGPPCQPFSKAGYWARGDSARLEDPRADTLSAYLRVLEEARPRAFLLENVQGLAFSGKDEGLRHLLDGIEQINKRTGSAYRPTVQVLNAARFGVPQLRERVFLIASREGDQFRFPQPTHGEAVDAEEPLFADAQLEPFRTAWDALGDVDAGADEELAVHGKWADLLPSIPEGQNYLWHTDRGVERARSGSMRPGKALFGWRRRYWTFLLKLAKSLPSWTIQAQPGPAVGPFHWTNRRLSMRELCRIQTFPDDVTIQGPRAAVQKQVGNAVPSLLGEVLGRSIKTQLLGLPASRGSLKLMPARRTDTPAPERYRDVPKKFLELEGEHSAHPGTGLGHRAVAREAGEQL
jgi:DNA (cytosine-5)-methyltransferase 1